MKKLDKEEIKKEIVKTNDIYHEIGYKYCTTIEDIKKNRLWGNKGVTNGNILYRI